MVDNTKRTLAQYKHQASPAASVVSRGLSRLQQLLSKQGIELDDFDELYTASISIIRFIAAKERKKINETLKQMEEE